MSCLRKLNCGSMASAKRATRTKVKDATVIIEAANKSTNEEFIKLYLKAGDAWTNWKHPKTGDTYSLSLCGAGDLSKDDFDACFNLIDFTSGKQYRTSSMGWHPAAKRSEMASPDLRYMLVKDSTRILQGFTSFMPTFEDGKAVVYCYEIHLNTTVQGTGLGKLLMQYILAVGQNIQCVEKVMLTCFVCNTAARAFYERMRFDVDDFSPGERKLRGGKTVKPDYVILSRNIKRNEPKEPRLDDNGMTVADGKPA